MNGINVYKVVSNGNEDYYMIINSLTRIKITAQDYYNLLFDQVTAEKSVKKDSGGSFYQFSILSQ